MTRQSELVSMTRNDGRFYRIAFQAVKQFMVEASPTILANYINTVQLQPDTTQGLNGVIDGIKFYKFPEEAYDLRRNKGILDLIIDGNQHNAQAVSSFYHATQVIQSEYMESSDIGCIDIESGLIYADELADAKARVISLPDEFKPLVPTLFYIHTEYSSGTVGDTITVSIEVDGTDIGFPQTFELFAETNLGAATGLAQAISSYNQDYDVGILNGGQVQSVIDTNLVWKAPNWNNSDQPSISIPGGEIFATIEKTSAGQPEVGEFDISSDYHNDIVDLIKQLMIPTNS